MKIDTWFSSPIAVFKNGNFDLTDHCLKVKEKYPISGHKNWIHNPYNSLSILEEETGYKAKNVKHLMKIYPMLGYSLQFVDCFVSSDLKNTGKVKLDDEEFLTVTKISFKKLLSMIQNKEIMEPRTICAALTYAIKKYNKSISDLY